MPDTPTQSDDLPTTREEKEQLIRAYFPDTSDKAVRNMIECMEHSERCAIAADRIRREAQSTSKAPAAKGDDWLVAQIKRYESEDAEVIAAAIQTQVDEAVREARVSELEHWADFFTDSSMNGMTPSERLYKRIKQLTTQPKPPKKETN